MKAITTERERRGRARQWLKGYQRPVRPWLMGALVAALVNVVAIISQLGLMAWLVHELLVTRASITAMTEPGLALICAVVLRSVSQAVQEYCAQRASASVRQRVRSDLLQAWARQGPVRLAGLSSGTLANQWVEQVQALDGYYARFLPQQWLAVLAPLVIGAVVLWLDWLAAIFLFLAAPLIPLFMALVGMSAERLSQRHVLEAGRLAGHFLDRVRSLTTLQLFGQVPAAISGVQDATERYREVNMRTLRVAFLSSAVLEFFASAAIAVVAMYIGFGLLGYIDYGPSGQLTLFSGLFILLLAPEFFQPLRALAQHYHDRAAALGAADSLADLESTASLSRPADARPFVAGPSDELVMEDLTLSYPGRGEVLRSVSVSLRRGEVVALLGPSGSGKSSLLHCAAGFVRPNVGSVSVFGREPGSQPIAWLDQRPLLIQGTWADNLRLLAPGAKGPAMLEALDAVGLSALLAKQPAGLETLLGENGVGLSGGQARRLALARAWLIDSDLVLLDEPTAGLDEASQAPIVAGIAALAASGRTIVMATHHAALAGMADRRLTLQHGRLIDA